MTYRDDHDAALARAEALAKEVADLEAKQAELEAERDALKSERDRLQRTTPTPVKPTPRDAAAPRRTWVIGGLVGAAAVGLLTVVIVRGVQHRRARERERAAYAAAVEARATYDLRWRYAIAVEPCVRDVDYDATLVHDVTLDHYDPRTPSNALSVPGVADRLASNCLAGAQGLADDPTLPAAARGALAAWIADEHALFAPLALLRAYYDGQDWRDDDLRGAPALWTPVLAVLAHRHASLAAVHRDALPALRAVIRDYQRRQEVAAGRDAVWWRVELGLMLWDVNDRSYRAAGITDDRVPFDLVAARAAVKGPLAELVARAKDAPVEVRRDLRQIAWITDGIRDDQPINDEWPWQLAHSSVDLLGRMTHDVPASPVLPPAPPPDDDGL